MVNPTDENLSPDEIFTAVPVDGASCECGDPRLCSCSAKARAASTVARKFDTEKENRITYFTDEQRKVLIDDILSMAEGSYDRRGLELFADARLAKTWVVVSKMFMEERR